MCVIQLGKRFQRTCTSKLHCTFRNTLGQVQGPFMELWSRVQSIHRSQVPQGTMYTHINSFCTLLMPCELIRKLYYTLHRTQKPYTRYTSSLPKHCSADELLLLNNLHYKLPDSDYIHRCEAVIATPPHTYSFPLQRANPSQDN